MSMKPKVAREFLYPVKSEWRDSGSNVVTYDNCDPEFRSIGLELNHRGERVIFNFDFDGYSAEERERGVKEAIHVLDSLILAASKLRGLVPDASS